MSGGGRTGERARGQRGDRAFDDCAGVRAFFALAPVNSRPEQARYFRMYSSCRGVVASQRTLPHAAHGVIISWQPRNTPDALCSNRRVPFRRLRSK